MRERLACHHFFPGTPGAVRGSRRCKNDAVGYQAAAFRPKFLLVLRIESQFSEAGEGSGPAELVVVFATVHGFLDVIAHGERIDILEQIETTVNIIALP